MAQMRSMKLDNIPGDTEGFDPSDGLTDALNLMTSRQIEEVMKKKGISLTKLAERSGIAQPTLSSFLHGTRPFSLKALVRCALALDAKITIDFKEN